MNELILPRWQEKQISTKKIVKIRIPARSPALLLATETKKEANEPVVIIDAQTKSYLDFMEASHKQAQAFADREKSVRTVISSSLAPNTSVDCNQTNENNVITDQIKKDCTYLMELAKAYTVVKKNISSLQNIIMTTTGETIRDPSPQSIPGFSSIVQSNAIAGTTTTYPLIEFKSSGNGLQVCQSNGTCRTNAQEHSGGQSFRGDLPGTSNSSIHYMKFRFYSDGYFAKNPSAHFAFGLRGKSMSVEKYGLERAGVDGRGLVIGNISGHPTNVVAKNKACGSNMAEIELFTRSAASMNNSTPGNFVVPSTCSDDIFEDNKYYRVSIEVTSKQYVIYKVFTDNNEIIHQSFYKDVQANNLIDPKLTEWFIGHVFETPNALWSVRLENLIIGHLPTSDAESPSQSAFASPVKFSIQGKSEATGLNTKDFSIVLNKKKSNHQFKMTDINGRKTIFGCAAWRETKSSGDNIDCKKAESYRHMDLKNETGTTFNANVLSYEDSFLNQFPPKLYTLYYRLNPADELTENSIAFELKETTDTSPAPTCERGNFLNPSGQNVEFTCGCGVLQGGNLQADGCYHKLATPTPTPTCERGNFLNPSGQNVEFTCGCGVLQGGNLQADGCYHKLATPTPTPAPTPTPTPTPAISPICGANPTRLPDNAQWYCNPGDTSRYCSGVDEEVIAFQKWSECLSHNRNNEDWSNKINSQKQEHLQNMSAELRNNPEFIDLVIDETDPQFVANRTVGIFLFRAQMKKPDGTIYYLPYERQQGPGCCSEIFCPGPAPRC